MDYEIEIQKIEKLGYKVYPDNHQCQIYSADGELIIDADFRNDLQENLMDAIQCFWTDYKAKGW